MAKKKVKKKKRVVKKKAVKKVKRVVRKKPVKKVRKKEKITASRKDFEVFAKGVERLEQLQAELNNLNTAGYEAEASVIRSKLKNVSYIPVIEKEISVLKDKIQGRYKGKSISPVNNKVNIKTYTAKLDTILFSIEELLSTASLLTVL